MSYRSLPFFYSLSVDASLSCTPPFLPHNPQSLDLSPSEAFASLAIHIVLTLSFVFLVLHSATDDPCREDGDCPYGEPILEDGREQRESVREIRAVGFCLVDGCGRDFCICPQGKIQGSVASSGHE